MAVLSADGTKILNNYDRFTGEPFNATVYPTLPLGAVVDNAIWFKNKAAFGGGFAKRDNVVNALVDWFGAVGDNISADNAAFVKAFNSGYPVELTSGKKYRITNRGIDIIDKDVILIGNGATIVTALSAHDYAISHTVSVNQSYVVPSANITYSIAGSEAAGITTIKVPGVLNWKAGDLIRIYSDDSIDITPAIVKQAEYVVPISVTTDASFTYLKFYRYLTYTYTTNIRVSNVKKITAKIKDVRFTSETRNSGALNFHGSYMSEVNNVVVENMAYPAWTGRGCYMPYINNLNVLNVEDSVGGPGPTGSVGYGVNDNNCYGLRLNASTFTGLRHSYTTGGELVDSNSDYYYYGEPVSAIISNCVSKNCQLAYDTHPPGTNISFENNVAEDCGAGYQTRSKNTKISGGQIKRCDVGVWEGTQRLGSTTMISDVMFDGILSYSVRSLPFPEVTGNPTRKVKVKGCNINGAHLRLEYCNFDVANCDIELVNGESYYLYANNAIGRVRGSRVLTSFGGFNGILCIDNCNIFTDNLVFDTGSANFIFARCDKATPSGNIFVSANNTLLGSAVPSRNTANDTFPVVNLAAFTTMKLEWKVLGASGNNQSSAYIELTEKTSDQSLVFPTGLILDEQIYLYISGLTTDKDLSNYVIPAAYYNGQSIQIINLSTKIVKLPLSIRSTATQDSNLYPDKSTKIVYRAGQWRIVPSEMRDQRQGEFQVAGSGQTTVVIPHGFATTPTFTNVNAMSPAARAAGITSWAKDATNITVTVTTPNTGGSLIYTWEARA